MIPHLSSGTHPHLTSGRGRGELGAFDICHSSLRSCPNISIGIIIKYLLSLLFWQAKNSALIIIITFNSDSECTLSGVSGQICSSNLDLGSSNLELGAGGQGRNAHHAWAVPWIVWNVEIYLDIYARIFWLPQAILKTVFTSTHPSFQELAFL